MVIGISAIERFQAKIEVLPNGCWRWTASANHKGYGMFSYNGRMGSAHRFSYQQFTGVISEGLTLDHICRNRWCVNPSHLEPVTNQENCRRGDTGIANTRKTHCPAGHLYSPENTYIYQTKDGRRLRSCRKCHAKREIKRRLLCVR